MLEIWVRAGKNIIQFSIYIFNSSRNFKATEKFAMLFVVKCLKNKCYLLNFTVACGSY